MVDLELLVFVRLQFEKRFSTKNGFKARLSFNPFCVFVIWIIGLVHHNVCHWYFYAEPVHCLSHAKD